MSVKNTEVTNKKVKCVVWDLDNTLWDGVLIEGKEVKVKEDALKVIKELDNRGILQSIASKNDSDITINRLKEIGIDEYFIYPQINWGPKSESISAIAESINIGIETVAFIDDQEFELKEVEFTHKDVLCINSNNINSVLEMDEMNPKFITEDSNLRRKMYINDIKRNKIEESFNGTKEEFLSSLNMTVKISEAKEDDLKRVEELTVRTHQLNTTGYTYTYDELSEFRCSDRHKLLVAELSDKFGENGKIGLTLLECDEYVWTIKLFIISCRVMSRGVGSVLLNYILKLAKENNVRVRAEFIPTDRNRMMYITYKFAGFEEGDGVDNVRCLENKLNNIQEFPKYIKLEY